MPKIIKFIYSHHVWSLMVIVFIALILRVILIDKIPGGLTGDEGLIVYNAWSIAETGADVFSDKLPIHLRGWGWGENSFIVYLIVALIKILGPFNVIIFRLSVVFFHLALIMFSFLLARELFDHKVGLLTALFLAFSPWDLALSRILFNVSILPCFFIAGLYFLIKGIRSKKSYFFLLAGFIFSLTFYIYALSFFWVPILLMMAIIAFWSEIRQLKLRHFLMISLTILFLSLPILIFYLKNQFGLFLNIDKILAFSLPQMVATRFDTVSILNEANGSLLLTLTRYYFSHLSPFFLFFNATLPCFVKYFGLLHFYQYPFIVLGLILILINTRSAGHRFLLLWLLAAPLPAALTVENIPHPLRFVSALPVLDIIASIGLLYFISKVEPKIKKLVILIITMVMAISIGAYFFNYFKIYPQTSFREYQAGSQEITEYIQRNYNLYDKVYIINNSDLYIFFPYNFLYFSHIPPQKIQDLKLNRFGLELKLDKINFIKYFSEQTEQENIGKVLYLMPLDEISSDFIKNKETVKEFKDLNNQIYFIAVK